MERLRAPRVTTMPCASAPQPLHHHGPERAVDNPTDCAADNQVILRTIGESWHCRESLYKRQCWRRSCAEDMDCRRAHRRQIARLGFPALEIGLVASVRQV